MANGSHRAERPDRLNLFSPWLDRKVGLRQIQVIHPMEADETIPFPTHRTVHRRRFLRRDSIESIPAARSDPDHAQPRPAATGLVLPTGGSSQLRSCVLAQN